MVPRGLILDVDGTLFDSDQAYEYALRQASFEPRGEAYLRARRVVKSRLGDGHVCARNRLLYFKALMEAEGSFSPGEVLARVELYERALAEHIAEQWRALDRARLFDVLSARYRIALLTNENTRTQLVKLRAIDPHARWFSRVLTSEELGVEKPHPVMFRSALAALGLSASDCIVVGDGPDADILPAVRLGLGAIFTIEFRADSSEVPSDIARIRCLGELEGALA